MAASAFMLINNKWNSTLFSSLDQLRADGVLCDVTVVSNDEVHINAHSSVLAASSSILKSCLVQAPRGHYVVKVPTISSDTWNLVISFIYTGKVRVLASEKDALVSAASTLGLTELVGLCQAVNGNPLQDVPPLDENDIAQSMDSMETLLSSVQFNASQNALASLDADDAQIPNDNSQSDLLQEEEMTTIKKQTRKNKYTCSTCNKSFPFGRSLLLHEMMHKDKRSNKHKCPKCDKTFASFHSLRAHERTHRYLPYKCNICNEGFHFRVNYELHRKKKHDIGKDQLFPCEHCGKEFQAVGLLNRHQAIVHKLTKSHQADIASPDEEESSIGGKCIECNEQFDDRQSLNRHYKTVHSSNREIKCGECPKVFATVAQLKEHFAEHSSETFVKPFKCDQCDRRFMYQHALNYHVRDAHDPDPTPRRCNVCGALVKSERMLAKHMKLHDGQINENTWKCHHCEKFFKNRTEFGLHMAEHRGEKTYYCKYCQRGFNHKGNYSTHMQRHLGIKPFSCEFCQKSFVRKEDMRSHMRVHTGERPYHCRVCGARFSGLSNLREHERAKHQVSFSKRNPVTTPRQHRVRVHRGSKTVESVDITQEEEIAELADVVTGVLQSNTENGTELVVEQQMFSVQNAVHTQGGSVSEVNGERTYSDLNDSDMYQMILDQASVGQNAPAILTRPVDHNGIVAGTQAVHGSETSTVVGP